LEKAYLVASFPLSSYQLFAHGSFSKMTQSLKLALFCLTIWPLSYAIYVFWFTWSWSLYDLTQLSPIFIVFQVVTSLILIALVLFYSKHLYHNPEIDDQPKLLWFIGIIFAGAFVMVFYWRKYIWHAQGL
jgi:hypothetical protein